MTPLYCATTNPGKVREFQLAANSLVPDGLSIAMLPGMESIAVCDETGDTFEANAIQKAVYYQRHSGLPHVFADDSGICVDALNGSPGVYSARYAGAGASDAENRALLLRAMEQQSQRSAQFVCVIALAGLSGNVRTFQGRVEGVLLGKEKGEGGFGYDPVFYYEPLGKTFAELSHDDKFRISHRGLAFRAMCEAFR